MARSRRIACAEPADVGPTGRSAEQDGPLAAELRALLRVAELVAKGARQRDLFDAVAIEASQLIQEHTSLLRVDRDNTYTVIANCGGPAPVDTQFSVGDDDEGLLAEIAHTRRPARRDDYVGHGGPAVARDRFGVGSAVGVPVIVDSRIWGVLLAITTDARRLPPDSEDRLGQFAGLMAAALANAQAGADLQRLADEQAALRQVAELIARGGATDEIFAAVAANASHLLDDAPMTLTRFDGDGELVVLANHGGPAPIGTRLVYEPATLPDRVRRGARAVRVDDYTYEADAEMATRFNLAAAVSVPITLSIDVWGMLTATSDADPMPPDTEDRLEQFAGLVAAALSNVQARDELHAMADEQAALRSIAELAAQDVPAERVLAAVARQASRLTDVSASVLLSYEPDGSSELVAIDGSIADVTVGMRAPATGDGATQRVWRTHQPARIANLEGMTGRWAKIGHDNGYTTSVAVPILIHGSLWGAVIAVGRDKPLPAEIQTRLANLADLAGTAVAAEHARTELQALADEQGALRSVAELAAQDVPAEDVLAAVAQQASRLTDVDFSTLLRYEPDGSTEIAALDGAPPGIAVGMRAPDTGDSAVQRVWRTGRPARIDNLSVSAGHWAQVAHSHGFTTSAAVPILIQGALWGVLVVVGRDKPLPAQIHTHLTRFADLAATAIAAAQARGELERIADEQAALRRVAELVARGADSDDVFTAVADGASRRYGDLSSILVRYEPDNTAVVMAACNSQTPVGHRSPTPPGTAFGDVLRTGTAVRLDTIDDTPLAESARQHDIAAGVAVPIVVEGRIWGALASTSAGSPLPPGTEDRLTAFAETTAASIANAEYREKLTASRARVVATADETRRRLQRDVHDSAQQRLVHTVIALKLAKQALAAGASAADLIDEALHNAQRANDELRDVVHGILPGALTHGGLRAGLESLAADFALPIHLDVAVPRLAPETETTAYFIVAEALTNAIKHAQANTVAVTLTIHNATLDIRIRDDGRGGADPTQGTGLIGLLDRVEAKNGTLVITSPIGTGTTVHATIPAGHPSA